MYFRLRRIKAKMALYSYVKKKRSKKKIILSTFSIVVFFAGIIILSWVLYPIASFYIVDVPQFGQILSPLPDEIIKQTVKKEIAFVLGDTNVDYTKASVWFPKASNIKTALSDTTYFLSIPKLGIDKALVKIGGEDLSQSLIHFTGPIPGEDGNPVIFGHSTLKWLYNPKDYKSIFTRLPDLKNNDEIFIYVDNITYIFKVYEMQVVSPNDVAVLSQNYNSPYITLITCVPPGTYFNRLIVRGRLTNI